MKFPSTHPWITFNLRLPQDDYLLWLKFGELASKCHHLAGVPLKPKVARELCRVYLIKGALATVAIEGNTLKEEQAQKIASGELQLPPSQHYLQQEIENILEACDQLIENPPAKKITPETIRSYNKQVLKGLEVGEDVIPGKYRLHHVTVGNVYRGAPPEECPYLVDKLCEWLNGPDFLPPDDLEKELQIPLAIVKAIVAHIYLAWIHPFGDGNGRTARLLEFHILYSCGIPLPAAHLLSNHYNLTRTQYYRELDKASRIRDIVPFIKYAVDGFLDGIREQIGLIRDQQLSVSWENYVYEQFRSKNTPACHRQRNLVLELSRMRESEKEGWFPIHALPSLSAKIALEYASKTPKTLQRDLTALAEMNLIQRKHGHVRAHIELMEAFLPPRLPATGNATGSA